MQPVATQGQDVQRPQHLNYLADVGVRGEHRDRVGDITQGSAPVEQTDQSAEHRLDVRIDEQPGALAELRSTLRGGLGGFQVRERTVLVVCRSLSSAARSTSDGKLPVMRSSSARLSSLVNLSEFSDHTFNVRASYRARASPRGHVGPPGRAPCATNGCCPSQRPGPRIG